jgi:hypothetical protein
MKEHNNINSGTVNWLQILIGATSLLLGTLVYLIDRPSHQTYFVYKSNIDISLFNILPNLFGPIGNNLPTFIHVFSFILITAGLISCQKRGYIIICISWSVVDCFFELGQKFKSSSVSIIPDRLAGIPFLENTKNFFLEGTFDCFDIGFICFGAIMAYLVLLITSKIQKEVPL